MTRKLLAVATGLVLTTGLIVASAWAGPGARPAAGRDEAVLRPMANGSLPFKAAFAGDGGVRPQAAAPAAPAVTKPQAVPPVAAPAVTGATARRSKLSAELEAKVMAAGNRTSQTYDVVVVTAGDPAQVQRRLGGAEVTRTYRRAMQGFAARLTAEQLALLRAMPEVESVGMDQTVHTTVDTAARWTGVTKLRDDFGITGDGDGFEQRYSGRDVVIAVVDTGICAS